MINIYTIKLAKITLILSIVKIKNLLVLFFPVNGIFMLHTSCKYLGSIYQDNLLQISVNLTTSLHSTLIGLQFLLTSVALHYQE